MNSSSQSSSKTNRRYSLFNRSSLSGNNSLRNPFQSGNVGSGDNKDLSQLARPPISRRGMSIANETTGQICQLCKRFEVEFTNTSDDLGATDAELKASRQVISLLQRQLELLRVEKEGLEKLITSSQSQEPLKLDDPSKYLSSVDDIPDQEFGNSKQWLLKIIQTQLYARDEELVKLKFTLKETQNDKEQLQVQLHLLEEDNAKLKSENSILSENITLRDQTIVSLSNEVFEQGNLADFHSDQRRSSSVETIGNQQSLFKAQRHMAKLIDTIDAYKKTNELLSENVIKLTERCIQAERKEIEARSQCQELEAKCCQIQSKLLSLLKEIEQSSNLANDADCEGKKDDQEAISSQSVKLLIKRLLEDKSLDIPLSWKEGNRTNKDKKDDNTSSMKYECDELGFYIEFEEEPKQSKCNDIPSQPSFNLLRGWYSYEEIQPLSVLKEVPDELTSEEDSHNRRREILRQTSVDATKSDEPRWHLRWDEFIKDFDQIDLSKSNEFKLLLRTGVPQEYRCKIWKSLVALHIGKDRQNYGTDYYQSLLEPNRPQKNVKTLNPSSKQIELDLLRTLPNNKHFETLDSSGTVRLRRVLTAYSEHNPKVGYCQGMNRLAAVALLVLPEEEAFWCLATIVDKLMPFGYYNDLWLAQVDSTAVMDFVALKMPELSKHFKENGIELSLFAWFLTIFVDGTPPALFLRLWDSFLYEGDKVLFRIALALLKKCESQLLQLNNSVVINNFLRSAVNAPMDLDEFFRMAYEDMNPLSRKALRARRQHHFRAMRSGFERASKAFQSPSPSERQDERRADKNDESPLEDSSIISI